MKDVENKVHEIFNIISKRVEINDFSLLSGETGIILFIQQYNSFFKTESEIVSRLQKCFDLIEGDSNVSLSYCSGVSGFVWLCYYFEKIGLIDKDANLVEDIYPYILKSAFLDISIGYYDFLHGAIGKAICLIKKVENNTISEIEKLIELIDRNKMKSEAGIFWVQNHNGKPHVNFGLSHGIPAMIYFLTECYSKKIKNECCEHLVQESLKFIRHYKNVSSTTSLYPLLFSINEINPTSNHRLCWCWGDLGVALVFLKAGKVFNNSEWVSEAIDIMHHSSKRNDLVTDRIVDAGLCHGTSGIAHIFNRFYFETDLPEFRKSAEFWFQETLKMAYHKKGLAGFCAGHQVDTGMDTWENEYGLLEGIAGIGLTLISYLSKEEPSWDECLLIS